MRIAIYKTGHEIADRVADSLAKGLPNAQTYRADTAEFCQSAEVHIGYGILRGMADIFRMAGNQEGGKGYFNLDRGFIHPSHFNGYYRLSHNGTQPTSNWIAPDYKRLSKLKLDIKPWRGFDGNKPVLIIPPTDHVRDFFGLEKDQNKWLRGLSYGPCSDGTIRTKLDKYPIVFNDYSHVITFNSSVGWQALQAGIPCVSDPTYSMVGSWFNNISLDQLADKQLQDRNRLFATMAASQFTLQEIEQGELWPYLSHCMSGSASMAGKQSPVKSPPTASSDGLRHHFQSTT